MREDRDYKNDKNASGTGNGHNGEHDDMEAMKKYIEKLLSFDSRYHPVTEEELTKIAKELGLSDTDLEKIRQEAERHTKKGKGFLKHQCYDQAVDEYNQAYAFSPLNPEILEGLALSFLERFFEKKEKTDREWAIKYANKGIELFPDKNCFYEIIKRASIQKAGQKPEKNTHSGAAAAGIAIVIILASFASLLGISYFSRKKENRQPVNETGITEQNTIDTHYEEPNELNIPVVFVPDDKIGNVLFMTDTSLYKKYDDAYSYTIKAEIFCPGYEVQRLTIKISTMDGNGKVINTRFGNVIAESDESVFPGDSIPLGELIYEQGTPPDIQKVEAEIYFIKAIPASGSYALTDQLPVEWETNRDENQNIEVYERESDYTPGAGTRYHFLVMRIKNTGLRPIARFRLGAIWYDQAGKAIVSNYVYVVADSQPQMNKDVVRSCRIIGSFSKDMPDFDRYELSVLEMK